MAGGKSRKTGGVSKALINRIKNQGKLKTNVKQTKDRPKGLLDRDSER